VIVLTHRLVGLLRYDKAFFATPEEVERMTERLAINQAVRLYCDLAWRKNFRNLVHSMPTCTVRVDLTKSLDAVFKAMDRKSCRYPIRAAEKLRDQMSIVVNGPEAQSEFFRLYNSFAAAKGNVPKISLPVVRNYAQVSDIYVLYLNNYSRCAHMVIKDEARKAALLMFSASRRLEPTAEADQSGTLNRYLHWFELQRYHALGYELYDFGGLFKERNYPSNRFKLSFGGVVEEGSMCTFSGAGMLARAVVAAYQRIGESTAARFMHHF
jgi:hypothetical protein